MKRRLFSMIFACVSLVALAAQDKPDALKLYRNGRDLEATGRSDDAKAAYNQAIEVCKTELGDNPKNMDAYSIYGWSLVRLQRYGEAVGVCQEALKVAPDPRVVETLGEAYFYIAEYKEALKNMEKYVDAAPKGERASTAYFFVGEVYRLNKQFNKAEMAYSSAVNLEPGISLWWYRLGAVRETIGDKTRATEAYQRALKLRPDYKEANEGLNRVRT
jgi:tetratricopeptide (TPR) repeat protein